MEGEATFTDGCYIDAEGHRLWTPERQWFSADDGLKTTRGLIAHLQQHPESVADEFEEDDVEALVEILQELQKVLIEAQQNGKRFNLTAGG